MEKYEKACGIEMKIETIAVNCPECCASVRKPIGGWENEHDLNGVLMQCLACGEIFTVSVDWGGTRTRYAPVDHDAVADARHWVKCADRLPEAEWEGTIRENTHVQGGEPRERAAKFYRCAEARGHWLVFFLYGEETFDLDRENVIEWLDLEPPSLEE